ncbi:prepilin-type N-terminal cleavage/methylation domain-containing protein [Sphingomonas sp. J315]|uniref:prepilin-type N-terminal cleavage/methylation domain-containing protein n=1 Tax=Sphingomonas sp. J315 TaxID=2898433 RepID=UPI0021ADAC21|nr:prepilin-type N-terminal cleavage/methylation domain-containing protein [Sphingomonas sp. J315]UUX99334.1 prepilin-type N-terminal cleavage/methylation domain-containing protein [Sphingomonas sp. J315]
MTLIEMLIVLVIIGVAAGGVALGVGAATRAPSVETEARRLALRLQAAADDAMIGDRIIAFTVEKDGYGFAAVGRDGSMAPLSDGLAFHRLPGGIAVELDVPPGDDGRRRRGQTAQRNDQQWRADLGRAL